MRYKILAITLLSIVGFTSTSCWEFRRQNAMRDAEAHGKALLLEAESSKKVQIEDAKGLAESSQLKATSMVNIAKAEAQAEIERAKGVAEANRIIGRSLQGNEIYLRYLQIDAIRHSEGEKIYIPTEAGIPIIEARKNE